MNGKEYSLKDRYRNSQIYFKEMEYTTERYVIPWIWSRFVNAPKRVLEVGSGDGGNLSALSLVAEEVVGVDNSVRKVELTKCQVTAGNVSVILMDAMELSPQVLGRFDLIILKDFIEHINQEPLLNQLKNMLSEEGKVFISYPPWQMPYGGHQQMCNSALGRIPWIHLLPTNAFIGWLRLLGEPDARIENMRKNVATGISIEKLRKVLRKTGYRTDAEQFYLINPGYEAKFKLEPRTLPKYIEGIPYLRNFFTTCCYLMVSADD